MKVQSTTPATEQIELPGELSTISLPEGLVGLPDLNEVELIYAQDQLPFLWLKDCKDEGLSFLVIEPCGLIPDYTVEINDTDIEFLDICSAEDLLLLNIVTLYPGKNPPATVNLVAPVAINRRTNKGKQVVLANYEQYSTHYVLESEEEQKVTLAN